MELLLAKGADKDQRSIVSGGYEDESGMQAGEGMKGMRGIIVSPVVIPPL